MVVRNVDATGRSSPKVGWHCHTVLSDFAIIASVWISETCYTYCMYWKLATHVAKLPHDDESWGRRPRVQLAGVATHDLGRQASRKQPMARSRFGKPAVDLEGWLGHE